MISSSSIRVAARALLIFGASSGCSAKQTAASTGAKAESRDASGSDAGRLAAPFRISITVPNVAPGEEGTKCLQVPLGNSDAVTIGEIHNTLSESSHHLVVSAVNDPTETEKPLFDCHPFKAVLIGAPLTVTQKHDDVIAMPDGVGFPLAANQLMHLEMHYINMGTEPADVVAESALYPLSRTDAVQEASFLIVGNLDITIPPNSTYESPPAYVALPAEFSDVNFYAATGHTHRLGTRARLATAANETDPGTVVYDPENFTWTEAPLAQFDPPFHAPPGGGFRFDCAWNNTTDQTVTYGESALQEMCFFWTYYYPYVAGGRRTLITGLANSPYAKKKDAGPGAAADAGLDAGH